MGLLRGAAAQYNAGRVLRCTYHQTATGASGYDVAALEAAFSERTACVILEWIQGEGGIYPADSAFLGRQNAQ